MAQLDSLYRSKSGLWGPYYAVMEQQLGATATLLDFGNQQGAGLVSASTWTGRRFSASGLAPTWTPSEPLSAFATPFDLKLESNWLGLAPILTMNGTDEDMTTPDANDWTRNDSASEKFSYGVWIRYSVTPASSYELLAKWDVTTGAELREYTFEITSTNTLKVFLYDESANIAVNRESDGALTQGVWLHVIVTYAGTGGNTAANGLTIYVNGSSVASTATNNASYVAMENLSTLPRVGSLIGTGGTASGFYTGAMLGGPWSPFFVQAELTAAQIKNIYENMRLGLGV